MLSVSGGDDDDDDDDENDDDYDDDDDDDDDNDDDGDDDDDDNDNDDVQESTRSKVYVAMDFSGRQGGRILDNPRDVRGCDKASSASKDGYVPFR